MYVTFNGQYRRHVMKVQVPAISVVDARSVDTTIVRAQNM